MLLCYIDESGNTGSNLLDSKQPLLLVGGVLVHEDQWAVCAAAMRDAIRAAASEISKQVEAIIRSGPEARLAWSKLLHPGMRKERRQRFTSDELIPLVPAFLGKRGRFELHAADILTGSGAFFCVDEPTRRTAINDALTVLERNKIPFLAARLDKRRHHERYTVPHPAIDVTMVCFTEALDDVATKRNQRALIISDKVTKPEDMKAKLASYQESGTPYMLGRKITHVIDSIHFVDSVESPLTQLADICTYLLSHDQRGTGLHTKEWARVKPYLIEMRRFN